MKWIELHWLRKRIKEVKSNQASISINSCTKLSKTEFFPFINYDLLMIYYLFIYKHLMIYV